MTHDQGSGLGNQYSSTENFWLDVHWTSSFKEDVLSSYFQCKDKAHGTTVSLNTKYSVVCNKANMRKSCNILQCNFVRCISAKYYLC